MSRRPNRRHRYGLTVGEIVRVPEEYLDVMGELNVALVEGTADDLLFKTNSLGHAWSGKPEGVPAASINPSRAIREMKEAGVVLYRLVDSDGDTIEHYQSKATIVAAKKARKHKKPGRKPRAR